MKAFLKKLLCRHRRQEFWRGVYGDERLSGALSVWRCRDCRAYIRCDKRHPMDYGPSFSAPPSPPAMRPISASSPTEVTAAFRAVLEERHRQVNEEGWTAAHDDEYRCGELAYAATAYAQDAAHQARGLRLDPERRPPFAWPWDSAWWKPSDTPRRNLVKAAALIVAEIERLDRATTSPNER